MSKINRDKNKFNFCVEADLHKGKNENGDDIVWIDGIASSTSAIDSDGEQLSVAGFNLLPLLESGMVNFNHQGSKDSNANIGVPVEAKKINDNKDLYVKCMLWPCAQTEGIVRAYDNFAKYGIKRKISYSIEGNATLRGSEDKKSPLYKKVIQADVTGLAVTFAPKNKNTFMNIIKGEYDTPFIEIDQSDTIPDIDGLVNEYDEWIGSDTHRGMKESILQFLQNYHEDDIDMLDDLVLAVQAKTKKSMDTAAISPATPESVQHNPNDISGGNTNIFGDIIKKSEIYISIQKRYPSLPTADYKNICLLAEKVQEKLIAK